MTRRHANKPPAQKAGGASLGQVACAPDPADGFQKHFTPALIALTGGTMDAQVDGPGSPPCPSMCMHRETVLLPDGKLQCMGCEAIFIQREPLSTGRPTFLPGQPDTPHPVRMVGKSMLTRHRKLTFVSAAPKAEE
ncbi:MAG: hypothetical protein H7Y60_11820 [Rhodospirillaceae bacterium]|nr:hypothetical protein [Rhodospirillales bacterium]